MVLFSTFWYVWFLGWPQFGNGLFCPASTSVTSIANVTGFSMMLYRYSGQPTTYDFVISSGSNASVTLIYDYGSLDRTLLIGFS